MSTPISDPNGTDNQTEKVAEQILAAFVKWFGVSQFVDSEKAELKALILACLPSWNKRAEISVSEGEQQDLGEKDAPELSARSGQKSLPFDFAPWVPPFTYDPDGTCIVDSQDHLILDVRGWGFLTGRGYAARGMDEDSACIIQNAVGEFVTNCLNASSVPDATENQGQAPVSQNQEWEAFQDERLPHYWHIRTQHCLYRLWSPEDEVKDLVAMHNNAIRSLPASKAGEETQESFGEKEA